MTIRGKVLSTSIIKINDHFILNNVALVDNLRYNLLSVSQLVDADFDVIFHKSGSHVLYSSGKLVYGISHIGKVFQVDFSFAQSSVKCLISQSLSELWKWHRRLGHPSFDLLSWLSGLGLLWGLPCSSLIVSLFVLLVVMARWSMCLILWLTSWWLSNLDSYYIWTLSIPLDFTPWEASGMFLSSLMTILATPGFSSCKVSMKCLSIFRAWLWGWTMSILNA
jgi:hypothetical protein